MTVPNSGMHTDVQSPLSLRLPTGSSAVCRCGAVYDYGDIVVPLDCRGMCGRCAAARASALNSSLSRGRVRRQ